MKALVTGGAGFIGSHLVDKLIEHNHQVIVLDDLSCGREDNLPAEVLEQQNGSKFYKTDIRDKAVSDIFEQEKPEVVFHLAAQKNVRVSLEDPGYDADVNIKGSLNLLENCVKSGVKKFIFSSTGGAIYGEADIIPTPETYKEQPLCPYGIAKLALEKYLFYYQQQYGLNYYALRYANVYGPRQDPMGEAGVVAIFVKKLLSCEQPVINGDGNQTRDYVYVADVVEANYQAFQQEKYGIYNIGINQEISVNELYQIILKAVGANMPEKHGPAILGEQLRSCLDYSLAKKELSWQPQTKLEEGIELTINYFKKQSK